MSPWATTRRTMRRSRGIVVSLIVLVIVTIALQFAYACAIAAFTDWAPLGGVEAVEHTRVIWPDRSSDFWIAEYTTSTKPFAYLRYARVWDDYYAYRLKTDFPNLPDQPVHEFLYDDAEPVEGIESWTSFSSRPSDWRAKRSILSHATYLEVGFGWPRPAFVAHIGQNPTAAPTSFPALGVTRALRELPGLLNFHRQLPLTVYLPGLAINTLVFLPATALGCALAMLVWRRIVRPLAHLIPFTRAYRRRCRLKRNRCPTCAYPLTTTGRCPECGEPTPTASLPA